MTLFKRCLAAGKCLVFAEILLQVYCFHISVSLTRVLYIWIVSDCKEEETDLRLDDHL